MDQSFQKASADAENNNAEEDLNDVLSPSTTGGDQPPSTHMAAAGELDGEWGQEDIQIPYLSLVNKSGQLSDEFKPGSFLYNKEVEVGDGKTPILITALTMKKDYVEDIPFDPEVMPRSFERLAEAKAEGYSLDFNADKRVKPRARILTLVPVPEGYGTFFTPDHLTEYVTDKCKRVLDQQPPASWALAMWILQSSAYNAVAKALATAKMGGHLQEGLHHGPWLLTSELRSNRQNSWFTPKVKAAGKHSKEFAQWVQEEVMPS